MQIQLKIDNREIKCKEYFDQVKGIEYLNLEFGDFQICKSIINKETNEVENSIEFIFERKTKEDLLASIKDGRYKNQKNSILSNFHHTQYYYIVEGSITFKKEIKNMEEKIIQGAIVNTMLRDKIGVYFTKTSRETCELIHYIYSKIVENPNEYFYIKNKNINKNSEDSGENRSENNSVEKQIICKKVKTPIECWREQLCQIPNMSVKTADAIISEFDSMKKFYNSFKDCSKEECVKKLSQFKTVDNNGKYRKISSRVVDNIIQYLLLVE